MVSLEIFCGKAGFSKVAEQNGMKAISVDIRKRKGVCEPTMQLDLLKVPDSYFNGMGIKVVYAAVPCTAFSYVSGKFYYDKATGYKPAAKIYLDLMAKTIQIIESLLEENPNLIFIAENPRARLRYEKTWIDFLSRNNGMTKYCTLSSYGFPTTKPTDIFTNLHEWQPRTPLPYGRGAKCSGVLSNMTTVSRQATPIELYEDLFKVINSKLIN